MSTHTYCWYNPTTNNLITNTKTAPAGYECIGSRKVAEAFTSTTKKEWKLLWENRLGGMLRIKNLPSKLKHKLKKLGIDNESYDW